MPPLLFKGVNKRRWDWTVDSYPWLPAGEYPAAPFSDFRVSECEDSVWHVDENGSNLLRLVAALAARRQNREKFDYVVVETSLVRGLGISIKETTGNSADPDANAKWHRDLVELTGSRLLAWIQAIHDHGEFCRVSEKRVVELLVSGMGSGQLDKSRIDPKLLASLTAT